MLNLRIAPAVAVILLSACGGTAGAVQSSSAAGVSKPTVVAPGNAASASTTVPGAVLLAGLVPAPFTFHVADLRQMPAETQQVSFSAGGQPEQHTFKGTRLINVLNAAKVQFDSARKNSQLRAYVLVTAGDGYQAVVTYGDLAAGVGDRPILLAWEQDGSSFTDKDGPRLVVPGDKAGGRYVSGIVRIDVRDAEGAPFVGSAAPVGAGSTKPAASGPSAVPKPAA